MSKREGDKDVGLGEKRMKSFDDVGPVSESNSYCFWVERDLMEFQLRRTYPWLIVGRSALNLQRRIRIYV